MVTAVSVLCKCDLFHAVYSGLDLHVADAGLLFKRRSLQALQVKLT